MAACLFQSYDTDRGSFNENPALVDDFPGYEHSTCCSEVMDHQTSIANNERPVSPESFVGKLLNNRNKKPGKKKRPHIIANLTDTKYSIVRTVCIEAGMRISENENVDHMLIWSDAPVPIDRIVSLKFFQKINHFPGMGEICRKDGLARNISKMHREFPDDFNFVPHTWVFPGEYPSFQSHLRDLKQKRKHRTFIIKPANGAMGNGIRLTRCAEKLEPHDNIIVQEYIEKPMLMENLKFDLRLYVLVTSCDPLKIFLYNEGLVRMSTTEYAVPSDSNLDCHFMHLTNYSINKFSDAFVTHPEEHRGSKRTLDFLFEWLKAQGKDVNLLWTNIQDIVVKTLLVAQSHIYRAYHVCRPSDPIGCESVCFEVLGFDILLDRKMKPWLLEVNRAPSFGTDQPLDYRIKKNLLRDTMNILNIRVNDRKRGIAQEKREAKNRLLRPAKRSDDTTAFDKRKILEQKRDQLKMRLMQLRREASREEYENLNMGKFKRVFPADDSLKSNKYKNILEHAAIVFTGRPCLERSARKPFQGLQEDEVLELLEQIEDNDASIFIDDGYELSRLPKKPKPLSSMPCCKSFAKDESSAGASSVQRPYSCRLERSDRSPYKRKEISKSFSTMSLDTGSHEHCPVAADVITENCEELTKRSLQALNDMRIKYPGKSDDEATALLASITENWKYHKPKVASYWLVKLDSPKRRKVIDIVRSNVLAILERIWKVPDVESLRLCRMFTKIFNRFMSNHGQGLWSCLNSSAEQAWEHFIQNMMDAVSVSELNCCHRVVQLCRECVLIVYEFASQAERTPLNSCTNVQPSNRNIAFNGQSTPVHRQSILSRK